MTTSVARVMASSYVGRNVSLQNARVPHGARVLPIGKAQLDEPMEKLVPAAATPKDRCSGAILEERQVVMGGKPLAV